MDFETVFAFDEVHYAGWGPVVVGLVILVVGTLAVAGKTFLWRGSQPPPMSWAVLTLGVFWSVVATITNYGEYSAARRAMETKQYSVIEGPVTGFSELPKKTEQFTVRGKMFSYSGDKDSPGFHLVRLDGGPVHEGEYVRVTYVDNTILKLEIEK
jgi:hypothetical protein